MKEDKIRHRTSTMWRAWPLNVPSPHHAHDDPDRGQRLSVWTSPRPELPLLLQSKHMPITAATMGVCFRSEMDVTMSSAEMLSVQDPQQRKQCWDESGCTSTVCFPSHRECWCFNLHFLINYSLFCPIPAIYVWQAEIRLSVWYVKSLSETGRRLICGV